MLLINILPILGGKAGYLHKGFQVFISVIIQIVVFWVDTLYSCRCILMFWENMNTLKLFN
jgi:hypothetical protein